jgi:LysM repeat protein
MRNTQQLFWMIFLILISIAMLFGVLSLSQAEGIIHLPATTLPPSPSLTNQPSNPPGNTPTPVIYTCPTAVPLSCPPAQPPTLAPTWTPTTTQSLPTPPPTWTPAVTQVGSTPSPQTWTPTQTTSPLYCPVPSGWVAYTVRTGDTVEGLALRYKITTTAITRANCQITGNLLPGMVIYLPSLPTRTPVACGAPRYWVIYIVQKGDTLFHLGQIYGIPYSQIQRANCLVNFNIQVGQLLYVPPWTPILPTLPFIFDTPYPTEVSTFYLPFETPPTETPSPTYDPAATTPALDTPTDFPTLTPTGTP